MDLKAQLQGKLKNLEELRLQLSQLEEQKQKLTVQALETQGACRMLVDMINAQKPLESTPAKAETSTPTVQPELVTSGKTKGKNKK